jgi:hypothetical protein
MSACRSFFVLKLFWQASLIDLDQTHPPALKQLSKLEIKNEELRHETHSQ